MFNFQNMFEGCCGSVDQDKFRVAMDGTIAVAIETKSGKKSYRAFDIHKGKMTNVGDFAFSAGKDMFFMFPTRELKKGDIVVIDGEPMCVLKVDGEQISVLTYDKNVVETRMVDNIMFLGKPMYGKVVSIFSMLFKQAGGSDAGMMKAMFAMSMLSSGQNGANPLASMFGVGGAPAPQQDGAQGAQGAQVAQQNPFMQLMPLMMMGQMFGGNHEGGLLGGIFGDLFGEEKKTEKEDKDSEKEE